MRVAISTDGGFVSQHFGRCPSFTMVDIEKGKTLKREEVENPGHSPGVIPKFLYEKGANMVASGGMGAKAADLFKDFGIQIVTGVEGSIEEVIQRLEKGVLESNESLCKPGAGKGYGVEKTECNHEHDE